VTKLEYSERLQALQTDLDLSKEALIQNNMKINVLVQDNNDLRQTVEVLMNSAPTPNTTKPLKPRDITQSLALKSLKALDESGEVFGIEGVALLLDMDAQWREIRQEKGLE
jgi:uncharacterized protein YaaN involved in tellurite resistance